MTFARPQPLKAGDCVYVVAPGGPVDAERLHRGAALLREAGLVVMIQPDIGARDTFFAGSDARRLGELDAALQDPACRAIWAARGGSGTQRLLANLPDLPRHTPPPWLIGFSDISALHARWARSRIIGLHGANVSGLADWTEEARKALFGVLWGRPAPAQQFDRLRAFGMPGQARGPILGGNLTVLAALCGCGELPSWQDALVFLEDVGEAPYRLNRAACQLRLSGALKGAGGILLGQFSRCHAAPGTPSAEEAVLEALAPLGLPGLAGLPVGHDDVSRCLPLGTAATLDTWRTTLVVDAF